METCLVTCPTCFENFEVPAPPAEETPSEVDYDCEVCCRPMVIAFEPKEWMSPASPGESTTSPSIQPRYEQIVSVR